MDLEPHLGDLEDEYRRHHLYKDQVSFRFAAIPWLIFTIYFTRADYLLFGVGPPFALLLSGKVCYCLITLVTLVIIRRITNPSHLDWIIFGWNLLSSMLIFGQELSRPRGYIGHYTLDVLVIISLYLVPNRLLLRLTPALFFSALLLTGLVFYKSDLSQLDTNAIVTACVLANLLGFISSTRLFTYRREQFRAMVEERQAKEALAALVQIDPLTGVLNRRAFSDQGVQELRQFIRYQHPFSVQVIDLDFFKQVNDTFGHQAGDEALKQFTQLVLRHKRETDMFGRLGGEEFGLILPNTSIAAAQTLGERLRELTQSTPIHLAHTDVPITLSMGVAEAQLGDTDFDELMNRADRLLYQAKHKGRNRVEYAIDVGVGDA